MYILIDESVLAFILEWKSGKFQLTKESKTLVTSYCLVWGVHTLCSIRVWGIVYLVKGIPEPPFR